MDLMIHDTTGTQTDCKKPLSRKKLKRLMRNNPGLTSRNLREVFSRSIGPKAFSLMKKKRLERSAKRKLFEKKTLPDGTSYQLMPNVLDLVEIKPTIFERVGGLFGKLRRQLEREKAKGK
jgi:hypothetical protein